MDYSQNSLSACQQDYAVMTPYLGWLLKTYDTCVGPYSA